MFFCILQPCSTNINAMCNTLFTSLKLKGPYFLLLVIFVFIHFNGISQNEMSKQEQSLADSTEKYMYRDQVKAEKFIAEMGALHSHASPLFQIKYFNFKGNALWYNMELDSAYLYLNKGLKIAELNADSNYIMVCNNNIGMVLQYMDRGEEGIQHLTIAYYLSIKLKKRKNQAKTALDISIYYQNKSQLTKAIYYCQIADSISTKEHDTLAMPYIKNMLGTLYQNVSLPHLSLRQYQIALHYDSINQRAPIKGVIALNLGQLYFNQFKNNDTALYWFQIAIAFSENPARPHTIQSAKINISNIYTSLEKFDSAIIILNQIEEPLSNDIAAAKLINLGICYSITNPDLAKEYLLSGIKICEENHFMEFEKNAYKSLAKIETDKKNYISANLYLNKIISLTDSIWTQDLNNSIVGIKATHLIEKQKEEKSHLMEKLKHDRATILNQKRNNYIIGGLLFLVILFTIILFYLNHKTRKANSSLLSLNQQLQSNKLELEENHQALTQTNKTLQQFFSILSHDLRSPISSSSEMLKYLSSNFESFNKEDLKEIIAEISISQEATYDLLENLLQWGKIQQEQSDIHSEVIDLSAEIPKGIESYNIMIKNKMILVDIEIEDGLTLNIHVNYFKTIVRNLVSNAIKFTPEHGQIILNASKKDNLVEIIVKDNGVGMSEETLNKIRREEGRFQNLGTNNEKGSGLGLKMIFNMVKLLNGEIELSSRVGEGTAAKLTFPNKTK